MDRADFNNDMYDASEVYMGYVIGSMFPRLLPRILYVVAFIMGINMLFGFGWWNITPANTPDSPFWVWAAIFVFLFSTEFMGR